MPAPEVPLSLLRPHSGSYRDTVTDHAIPLLAQHGAGGVTLRALADRLQMTPPGVRRWFGSIDKTWAVIADTFGRRWVQWHSNTYERDPECTHQAASHLALPLDESEVAGARAWFALTEHCTHSEDLARILTPWHEHEARAIGRLVTGWHREALEGVDLAVVVALVRGLRLGMVDRHVPLDPPEAQEALRAGLAALLPTPAGVHARE